MDRWAGKVAVVTGASAGIGKATAASLVKAGMLVVGLARRIERMQAQADKLTKEGTKGRLHAVKCDMRVEDDILKAFEWITKNVGNVHVLVNNAGVGASTSLSEGPTEEWRKIFETNVIGLCIATREAIKIMKANGIEGHIVHVNGIVGHEHLYFPTVGVYGASKHAVTNLTDIMRQEMIAEKSNIKVTSISPGPVRSEFAEVAGIPNEIMDQLSDKILECQDIADGVMYVLSVPHRVHINDLTIRSINSPF